jgi:hypothetical protein
VLLTALYYSIYIYNSPVEFIVAASQHKLTSHYILLQIVIFCPCTAIRITMVRVNAFDVYIRLVPYSELEYLITIPTLHILPQR